LKLLGYVSIRASLQQRGEHASGDHLSDKLRVSIRASLQQRGERAVEPASESEAEVSIRASLQQRGERPWFASAPAALKVFQSAPHFSSEANSSLDKSPH